MLSLTRSWTLTLLAATLAVAFAAAGLSMTTFYPGQAPLVTTALLFSSLAMTALAFGRVAMRLRRMELENEGLIAEIAQEFDRVKDKVEILGEALEAPRSLTPEEAEIAESASARRVMVK